jgi:preprotein translocase subunit YajC
VDQLPGLIFLALPLLLIWMVFSRTRRQQRTLAAAQASIEPGLWVMTTSGLHGQVISAGDEPTVLLEISPGVHTRWARQAIAEVFDEDPATKTQDDPASADSRSAETPRDDSDLDDRDDRKLN